MMVRQPAAIDKTHLDRPQYMHSGHRPAPAVIPQPLEMPCALPGAEAMDKVDGNVTRRVVARHVPRRISTEQPTSDGSPFLIQYTVSDSAGNSAPPIIRHVVVKCPSGLELCPLRQDRGALSCRSDLALCQFPDVEALSNYIPDEDPEATTSLQGRGGVDSPTIQLLGPEVVRIPFGWVYTRCNRSTPPATVCERGAAANDGVDGDLTARVKVATNARRRCLETSRGGSAPDDCRSVWFDR